MDSYYVKIEPSGAVAAGMFGEKENTLSWLQEQVGGYIETIPVPDFPGFEMMVNEEGKLKGLDENPKATELADCLPFDVVVGPVVVVKTDGDEFAGLTFQEALKLADRIVE